MDDLTLLEEFIREALLDEAKRKRKKAKKKRVAKKRAAKKGKRKAATKKSSSSKLSAATKATLKKKAEKRGLTPSSVYAEFSKGIAAYYSSGSRPGMSPHQWAHARVNSATPSKSWAVVKKSKAKKKK